MSNPRNVRSIRACGFDIRAYSRAGIATSISVRTSKASGKPKLAVGFDIGLCTPWTTALRHILITHCHTDHIGALAQHARARGTSRPTYFAPAHAIPTLKDMQRIFNTLDGTDTPAATFVPVKPGDFFHLDSNYWVGVFATEHRVESVGYVIFSRKRQAMPEDLRDKPFKEVLATHGQEFVDSLYRFTPEVCYTGDLTARSLLSNSLALSSRVLITELTFLGQSVCASAAWLIAFDVRWKFYDVFAIEIVGFTECLMQSEYSQTCLTQIKDYLDAFKNGAIIFVHFSTRHSAEAVISSLARFGPSISGCVVPALEALDIGDSQLAFLTETSFRCTPVFGDIPHLCVFEAISDFQPLWKQVAIALARRCHGVGAVIVPFLHEAVADNCKSSAASATPVPLATRIFVTHAKRDTRPATTAIVAFCKKHHWHYHVKPSENGLACVEIACTIHGFFLATGRDFSRQQPAHVRQFDSAEVESALEMLQNEVVQ